MGATRLNIPAVNIGGVLQPSQLLPEAELRAIDANASRYIVLTSAAAFVDAGVSPGTHGRVRLEALGVNSELDTLPPAGVSRPGFPVDGSDVRFAFTVDPDAPTAAAIKLALDSTDPLTAGATRIELGLLGSAYFEGADATFGFSIRTGDWPAADEQVTFQLKSIATAPGNPYLSQVIAGPVEKWVLRYNANDPPLQASNTTLVPYTGVWQHSQWAHYVVRIKRHWSLAQAPFCRVYKNGVLLFDYAGPVSFNVPGDPSQMKVGIYHYTPPAWAAPLWRVMHTKGLFYWPSAVDPAEALSILQSI